ncbi:MAG TPA: hypothetical protein VGG75_42675 [Trebonia sp.]|jgi:hypothetical protein
MADSTPSDSPSAAQTAANSARREASNLIPARTTAGSGPRVQLGPVSAPVIPLLLMAIGGYLLWFGVHYFKQTRADGSVLWPTDPVKSFLTGKTLTTASATAKETATLTAAFTTAAQASPASGTSPSTAPSSGGSGQVLTASQIQQLWTQCGGASDTAAFASKVAMAESGGRTAVTSTNPDGGTNVGLYQLDTKGVGAGYSVAQLSDPTTNTRITIMATNGGTDWQEWGDPVTEAVGYVYTPQLD